MKSVAYLVPALTLALAAPPAWAQGQQPNGGKKSGAAQVFQGRLDGGEKAYDVELQGGKTYVFTYSSKDYDCLLIVRQRNGLQVASDDDGGGGLNSQLTFTPGQAGTYRVVASSYNGDGKGAFELTIRPREPAFTGRIDAANPIRKHDFQLKKGTRYTIELTSGDFDPYLVLQDGQGKTLEENDDAPGGGLNSRIAFTPPETGTYRVIAAPLDEGPTGGYAVFISPPPEMEKK